MHRLLEKALDLLYPPNVVCFCCNEALPLNSFALCEDCTEALVEAEEVSCPPGISGITAAFLYQAPVDACIHRLKYGNEGHLAKLLAEHMKRPVGCLPDYVLPVPLHPNRRKARGYNQSELLARAFAELHRLHMDNGLLFRARDTQSQTLLDVTERKENMRGAFRADARVEGKALLLIDDVTTSGSTLQACAQTLLHAGAKSVHAACACAAPKG